MTLDGVPNATDCESNSGSCAACSADTGSAFGYGGPKSPPKLPCDPTTDPQQCRIVVAVQPGPPVANKPCFGSPGTVDDSFWNKKKQDVEIVDINSLWADGTESGWLYLGSDGQTYIQYNYADQAVWSWAVSIGIASGGASTPGGYSGIMLYKGGGVGNVAGAVQGGTQAEKCFQQGKYLGGNFA